METILHCLGLVVGIILVPAVLFDAFETMVLPRRVTRAYRIARYYYRHVWTIWRAICLRAPTGKQRENLLGFFGPLSVLGLLLAWASCLILGFGLVMWSVGVPLKVDDHPESFLTYMYMSGASFFTIGYGDVVPRSHLGRLAAVFEGGTGFGFMAVVIGYLPVLYQAFSKREVTIGLLDARAGSPPTAAQLLLRAAQSGHLGALDSFLKDWEQWSGELLESHLSFPVLGYYRSQHDNQSWLAALSTVLDCCTLIIAAVKDVDPYQAKLTFAMARHSVVDLALVFNTPPPIVPDRLSPQSLDTLRQQLAEAGIALREGPTVDQKVAELRGMYEPFVQALAERFLFTIPPFSFEQPAVDNWQTSAWMRRTVGISHLSVILQDDHFS